MQKPNVYLNQEELNLIYAALRVAAKKTIWDGKILIDLSDKVKGIRDATRDSGGVIRVRGVGPTAGEAGEGECD